eukprot:TRINITY_DN2238_c0_g1_i2.p1 TRINITY_DN2238_c0_g1~~TRINITY_DN2238_c0_g1_i2.p1  ORF type:complete len:238 (+),score=73.21 TRINITY_DN2238_c0_g1_i2:82-795(+)
MSDDGDGIIESGAIVLGYHAESEEWKTCEVIRMTPTGYEVHFEDDPVPDSVHHLTFEEVQLPDEERFQVGDQVLGWLEETWQACEVVEVLDNGYRVHFLDHPEGELVDLEEEEVAEEQVLDPGTEVFGYIEETMTWKKGVVMEAQDEGYLIHFDDAVEESYVIVPDECIRTIDFNPGDQVLCWYEEENENGEGEPEGDWYPATLVGVTDTGYRIHFDGHAAEELSDVPPDYVDVDQD